MEMLSSQNTRELYILKQVHSLEEKLRKINEEKVNAQARFATFKKEGSAIIHTLKNSLIQITERYKKEKMHNTTLTQRVNELEQQLQEQRKKMKKVEHEEKKLTISPDKDPNIRNKDIENKVISYRKALAKAKKDFIETKDESGDLSVNNSITQDEEAEKEHIENNGDIGDVKAVKDTPEGPESPGNLTPKLKRERKLREKTERMLETKIEEYKILLQEEELIQTLQNQIARLEKENERLKTTLSLEGDMTQLSSEYMDLYNELSSLLDPEEEKHLQSENDTNLEELQKKINAQNRLLRLLLKRLKAEERKRLKTEENMLKVTDNEKETMTLLESKIKDLEHLVSVIREDSEKERKSLKKLLIIK